VKRTAVAVLTLVVVTSGVLVGCGVRAQDSAERIAESDVPFGLTNKTPPSTVPPQASEATVFLLRGARLAPVVRRLSASTPRQAVEALLDGPTPEEGRAGLTTAVPTSARLNRVRVQDGIAVVDLGGEFLQTNVGDSALGIAQFVNTLAQFPQVLQVRFELDGEPVGVPRGDGTISRSPVGTSDYPPVA